MLLKVKFNYVPCALFFFIFSCQTAELRQENQKQINQWLGKKIEFPKELMILKGNELTPFTNTKKRETETLRIVSIVDASCTSCILDQLNRIDSLFQTILVQPEDIIFILNVNKSDSSSFRVAMQPFIKAKGCILWDSDFYFETANDIFSEKLLLRTFLINQKHEIVLVGNPLLQPDLLNEYRRILRDNGHE